MPLWTLHHMSKLVKYLTYASFGLAYMCNEYFNIIAQSNYNRFYYFFFDLFILTVDSNSTVFMTRKLDPEIKYAS